MNMKANIEEAKKGHQKLIIPIIINDWWDELNHLQQQNLANLVFNRLNDQWKPIDEFYLDENDKKLLYVFENCLRTIV